MKHTTIVSAGLALALVLSACSGQPAAPAASINGPWSGTWTSSRGGGGSVQTTFTQDGSEISGSVSVGGSPCLSTGTLSGTITSSNVSFGAVSGSHGIQFTATVGTDAMSGTYIVSSGLCAGDAGTFSLVRQ
jgi:hypothetical protein